MGKELAPDNAIFRHKKEGYLVRVEHSAPQGVTLFRRVTPILTKVGTLGSQHVMPIARLRTRSTASFVKLFERVKA